MAHGKTKRDTVLKLTHKMPNMLLQTGAKYGVDWIIRDGAGALIFIMPQLGCILETLVAS